MKRDTEWQDDREERRKACFSGPIAGYTFPLTQLTAFQYQPALLLLIELWPVCICYWSINRQEVLHWHLVDTHTHTHSVVWFLFSWYVFRIIAVLHWICIDMAPQRLYLHTHISHYLSKFTTRRANKQLHPYKWASLIRESWDGTGLNGAQGVCLNDGLLMMMDWYAGWATAPLQRHNRCKVTVG